MSMSDGERKIQEIFDTMEAEYDLYDKECNDVVDALVLICWEQHKEIKILKEEAGL